MKWLDDPPENWENAPEEPPTGHRTYVPLQSEILIPRCVKCHDGPMGAAQVDLSTYEAILGQQGLVVPRDFLLFVSFGRCLPAGSLVVGDAAGDDR